MKYRVFSARLLINRNHQKLKKQSTDGTNRVYSSRRTKRPCLVHSVDKYGYLGNHEGDRGQGETNNEEMDYRLMLFI